MDRYVIVFAILIGIAACSKGRNQTKWQYMPDMVDSPAIKTQRNYLDFPEHSIAREMSIEPKDVHEAENVLKNPIAKTAGKEWNLRAGKKLWGIYCQLCHGEVAKGGGPMGTRLPAPDLTAELYRKRSDVFLYHRIKHGGALMPSYGHSTSKLERWQIVAYLRKLQNAAKENN